MTLRLSGPSLTLDAPAGVWLSVDHPEADAAVAAVAGVGPGDMEIVLDGESLTGVTPVQRHAAQLCTASCRLDPLPALRVADVIGLGLRAPQPALWQSFVGTLAARTASADDEASVRALAGRVGLARWVDRTAVNLPLKIEALIDLARAFAGVPKALVWRRPEWLDPISLAEVHETVMSEQSSGRFTVVEFVQRPNASLSPQ
jgi:ABC-type branched-subunit amino acid transport system ATPase component